MHAMVLSRIDLNGSYCFHAGASTQLPLLRGPVVSTAAPAPLAQPAASVEQAARAMAFALNSRGSTGMSSWQSQGGGPPSPAAAAAQAALRRCA